MCQEVDDRLLMASPFTFGDIYLLQFCLIIFFDTGGANYILLLPSRILVLYEILWKSHPI